MQNFFEKKSNLIITKKLNHSDWIENCNIVVHNGCTAGVEAFARNKKLISYEPLENETKMTFANNFGYTAKNEKELGNIIEKIENFGNRKILICERGTSFGYNNLVVDMLGISGMKKFTYPVLFDVCLLYTSPSPRD